MNQETINSIIRISIAAIVTLALGVFIFNQSLELFYKIEFLSTPCELCMKLNPEWEECYKLITTPVPVANNYSFASVNLSEYLVANP
jgi:hypothetical protein